MNQPATNTHKNGQAQPAIIYCRVSSVGQKRDGHGLESQEARCRQHAAVHGYEVEAVFPDHVTGGGDFMNRPGMVGLLSFIAAQPDKNYVIIFDDLKRFARDTDFHRALRRKLDEHGARPECLNFRFEDTPEGEFIETIVAAQGELERKQNRRQVIQKMKARVEKGYWVFHAPMGLKYQKTPGHGKLLVRDEPIASILQEAFEGFAYGRFQTQAEVKRYLEEQPDMPKCLPDGSIRLWRVTQILTNALYAGYIEVPRWKVARRDGLHEGIVSPLIFNKAQAAMDRTANAPKRPDLNEDFPLRGFVVCNDCEKPMTACWSKGKYKQYPYYWCHTKGCDSHRKSIPRDKLETAFEGVLKTLRPSRQLFTLILAMFKDAWSQRLAQSGEIAATIKKELRGVDKQIDNLMDRIADGAKSDLIPVYEAKLEKLGRDRLVMKDRLANSGKPQRSFEEMFELSCAFLANPCKLWETGRLDLRRTVLRLAFEGRLAYSRETGFRTPNLALPFKALGDFQTENDKWCGREDSNFHGSYPTATSTLRVYQFRHDRTPWTRADNKGRRRCEGGCCVFSVWISCRLARLGLSPDYVGRIAAAIRDEPYGGMANIRGFDALSGRSDLAGNAGRGDTGRRRRRLCLAA